jgi:transcription-repair coupling factor (superfamily II helicase)
MTTNSFFNPLFQKICSSQKGSGRNGQLHFHLKGINEDQWSFIFQTNYNNHSFISEKNHLLIFSNSSEAEDFLAGLNKSLFNADSFEVFFYPSLGSSPYSGLYSSENNLFQQWEMLQKLTSKTQTKKFIILTTFQALAQKVPPPEYFNKHKFSINVSDIAPPFDLAKKLLQIGMQQTTTIEEPGTFSRKGEIFDIFNFTEGPVRLSYYDDMIEEIHPISLATNKSRRDVSIETITLAPTPYFLGNKENIQHFRANLPIPPANERNRFQKRSSILSKLSKGELFEDYPKLIPLFFDQSATLLDYLDNESTLMQFFNKEKIEQNFSFFMEELNEEFEEVNSDSDNDILVPAIEKLINKDLFLDLQKFSYIDVAQLSLTDNVLDNDNLHNSLEMTLVQAKQHIKEKIGYVENKHEFLKKTLSYIFEHASLYTDVIFTYKTKAALEEIQFLTNEYSQTNVIKENIHYLNVNIKEGFYYQNEKLLVLSEGDLFNVKKSKTVKPKKKQLDLFAEQISTLKEGDFVIHSEHGVGVYHGLETLDIGSSVGDFITIQYAGKDKVYVPVYKINLIQKHADNTANLKVDNLKSSRFQQVKSKAKKSAKKLAIDLLRLQAQRATQLAFPMPAPDHYYKEFELAFPFQETNDQHLAICDVLESMQKSQAMDHLVCGDVGFGKTEVAMRAAFLAVLGKKQVAVLVPTTILSLQHYHSFVKRFKGFPVRVEFISRLKSTKEVKEIKEKLAKGFIDIIIGTHKLLAKDLEFKDLGLVVVDEEQRFGVAHKEKLKSLRPNLHFLTLSATPIPRTLQMAFIGIRDLSLIQTAPPKRQSIKTYLIKEDKKTIKDAIEKEIKRGGQVFYVHNRVQSIETVAQSLRELIPGISILVAHGQMPEKLLEKCVTDFYNGKYQVLLSTTIIESGLDIPNANTMIVDKAHMFGLSQLHQLRGRIGRSDKKAYAYFIIPQNIELNGDAEKRLNALKTYADIGSGFNLASADLEIRGAGEVLGGEQSGHIETIGLELYTELLKEAIDELKGEKEVTSIDIEITTPFPCYIPNHYIEDNSERLKTYKKLSNLKTSENIDSMIIDLEDIFGPMPKEVLNLSALLKVKKQLKHSGIKSIQVGHSSIHSNFEAGLLEKNDKLKTKLIDLFIGNRKKYQITPKEVFIYTPGGEITPEKLLEYADFMASSMS